jgi:uncharacterized membrane protein (UPF0182 family)
LIEADPNICRTFSLLDQRGSQVVRGAAQLIPVGDTIFYVRPIYIEGSPTGSSSRPLPRWNYVAVTYGEEAVLDTSVSSAVKNLIAGTIPQAERDALNGDVSNPPEEEPPTTTPTTPDTTPGTTPNEPPPEATVEQLLALAQQASDDANAALTAGNLTEWAADIQRMQRLVNLANQKLEAEGSGGSPTTTAPAGATATTRPRSTTTTVARA